ncbi:MAG: hypothetical protein DI603_20985 [Roseateles depolymerans]|uniref:Transmembrane protein n=1 Tax=Roseateles depolymerans TaxID=76731 RepID=A0A2W5DBT0_9BURK|nr:MAG: hypothetical protein DI603_20985 [Roseateles depolymerans]
MSEHPTPRPYTDPTAAPLPITPGKPAETPAWQQASRQPRRAPPPARPRPVRTEPTSPGYIASHWRGEQGLARSYWVNNVLLATPLALLVTGLMSWISVKGDSLQVSASATLIGIPLLILLDVWCIVGAWRSAGHYLQDGGARLWGWLARLSLALGALQLIASVLLGFAPNVGDYWQMARGRDPIGQVTLSLSGDGRSLRLAGPIGMGDGERLRAALASDAASAVRRVELESPGGRLREAEKMADALRQRGTASRAVGTCASACTLVFLAGQPRQMGLSGRLGFHRASTGTYNPVFEELANQQLAQSYRRLGLPQTMIDTTLATPSSGIWFAPSADLQAHGLIAPMPQTLAIDLPPAAGSSLADFQDALQMHPVWQALERRQDGLIAKVATQMWSSRAAGADDDAVQAAALPPLAQQMPALLQGSDAAARRRYVQLVADQLRALRTPARPGTRPACRDLLDGHLAARAALPLALQVRESQWIREAAEAAPPRWLPKAPSAIETEVMARTVGAGAQGLLASLWADTPESGAGRAAASCEPVIALLDRARTLPPARRELVERLLFQPPR